MSSRGHKHSQNGDPKSHRTGRHWVTIDKLKMDAVDGTLQLLQYCILGGWWKLILGFNLSGFKDVQRVGLLDCSLPPLPSLPSLLTITGL